MYSTIQDVIENGDITIQKGGNYRIEKDGKRAIIAKNENGDFVLTAYDANRSIEEKKRSDAVAEAQRLVTEAVVNSLEASGIEVVEASDAMYREKYGVSEEEYWANEAQWDEFIESREMSAEELENYDNFVAEERIKEEHERRNQENAEDEQRSDNSESEGGVEVLSGTQPDITRGDEDVAGESEGVDGNGVESNDVASEEAAELSEEDRQAIENMPIPTLKRRIKDTTTTLFNVSQTSDQWQAENKDKIERAKLLLAYAKQELARKERLKKSNKWGVKVGNTATPFDVVRKMFEEFNSNEDLAQLFEKVAKVFETLPIKVVFSDTIGGKSTQGWFSPTTGTLKLPGYFVYGGGISEQNKAETILHEMIHAVTTYALYINEKPYLQTELGFRLSDDMHAAIRQLKRIYASIANDKDFKGEYGAVSVHEMIAELSNVQFREKLKKKGLWETIVDAIKQLFGITPSNALEGAEAALEYMLNNFDRSQWEKMVGMGEKRGKQMRIGVDKQIIGERGASALDKADEATHRMDNLGVAREMEADGKDAKAIRMATGWERGADGKWRYEIEDFDVLLPSRGAVADAYNEAVKEENKAQSKWETKAYRISLLPRASKKNTQEKNDAIRKQRNEANKEAKALFALLTKIRDYRLRLENQLRDGLYHKLTDIIAPDSEIFKSYPQLRDITITIAPSGRYLNTNGYLGSYDATLNSIFLDWNRSEKEMKSTLIHEIQHAIQEIEGFAKGGNSTKLNDRLSKQLDVLTEEITRLRAEGKHEEADAIVKRHKGLAEAVINNSDDNFGNYRKLGGEVEARNASARMGMSADERRATLLSETEDVAREDQIFLMENSGVSAMGSTVVKRKADIAVKLQGKDISPTQLKVVNAFTTDVNNIAIDVVDANGKQRNITLKQGQDNRAGVKHSVLKHYETASNSYSAEDILLIPQIIEQGERKQDGKKVSYKLGINGVTYSVTTEINNRGAEVFTNFYTNRSGNARSSNTQLSAQADSTTTSASKGSDNIGDVQGLEDHSAEEIKEIAREYIEDVIAESGFDAEVVDLAIYGSRRRGDAREDSDLDIVVEYSGNAREDDLFNALNDAETQLEIDGVKVDINPITKSKSGTLGEFMERAREYDEGNGSNRSTKESQPLTNPSAFGTSPKTGEESGGSLEDDGLLFRDGEVFYSNAEEAVRNIKQEKATPEQWIESR